MRTTAGARGNLRGHRVYLSGPMGFVASRKDEMKFGWRNRVGEFLRQRGVVVRDPWAKPRVRWFYEYGRETRLTEKIQANWTFGHQAKDKRARAECAAGFKRVMHVDLRMVDTSDFLIAYCPTNIYSVGTVHEIVVASLQHKPVLVVSPKVEFPALAELQACLGKNRLASRLLSRLEGQVPIKPNPRGIPHPWYMALLNEHSFFDGFGFSIYAGDCGWGKGPLDAFEDASPPKRPLLRYLDRLDRGMKPTRFDPRSRKDVKDEDWLLLDTA